MRFGVRRSRRRARRRRATACPSHRRQRSDREPALTRLAVIADTHLRGGRPIPEQCAAIARECDVILHAGDIADAAALDAFAALGPPLIAVAGNVDLPEVSRRLP